MFIVNADDFGINHQTNKAIVQSFKKGLCSSTTIMPNMPGFQEACQLAHENKLQNHVGLHLVLRDGFPLTQNIKKFRTFCDKEGQLILSEKKHHFYFNNSEKKVLTEEIIAQIKMCRNNGIDITHIDSHHHTHNDLAVINVLIPIAKSEKIPYIRLARTCGPNLFFYKKIYKKIFNFRLKINNLAKTANSGSLEDFLFLQKRIGNSAFNSFELMIHPGLDENGLLIDTMYKNSLEESLEKIILNQKIVSFTG